MAGTVGPTPNYPGASIWTAHPKSQANQRDATQQDVQSSGQAINDAVARNQQTLASTNQEGEAAIQHIRDEYSEQSENEKTKEDDALAKQQLKGYEALRALKRQQDAELYKTHKDGEAAIKSSQDYFRDTTYATERQGEEALQAQKIKESQELEYATRTAKDETEAVKSAHEMRLDTLKKTQDQMFAQTQAQNAAQREQLQANTQLSIGQEMEKFQAQYKSAVDSDTASLDRLNSTANQQINQVRQDTAQKLSAYSSRQSDPFYKMMDMKAHLTDEGTHFVLTANIPTHEQDGVSVAVKGNMIVLFGTRRNEEKMDIAPGHFKGTSSYQTFNESFPLSAPVDRNGLTKEFHGDQLTIRIPKTDPQHMFNEAYKAKEAPVPPRLRAERPQFPGNLPGVPNPNGSTSQTATADTSSTTKRSGRALIRDS